MLYFGGEVRRCFQASAAVGSIEGQPFFLAGAGVAGTAAGAGEDLVWCGELVEGLLVVGKPVLL